MEQILKPDKLETDPHSQSAEREYKHWKQTFENFLDECKASSNSKLRCLTKYVSSNVYDYFSDSATFDEAIKILDGLYLKPKNIIYARHLLATRRQEATESLDEYLQVLHRLSKDCKLTAVTAEQYREELVRDAFINGLLSPPIRQRLLENQKLTLSEAFDQARSLDSAQRNSAMYDPSRFMAASTSTQISEDIATPDVTLISSPKKDSRKNENTTLAAVKTIKNCWFCGNSFHQRSRCPAKNSECSSCGKYGHWAKVCQSRSQKKVAASVHYPPSLCAITAAVPNCLRSSSIPVNVNGHELLALIDSASSDSFINERVVQNLKLETTAVAQDITLALSSSKASVVGTCEVDLHLDGRIYSKTQLGVLKDLCGDVILGIDFQKRHKEVTIKYGGCLPNLTIDNCHTSSYCSLVKANVQEPSLFPNLRENIRPVATKSRNFGKEDREFIAKEIQHLLNEDVIEHSNSPWRAQVVIARNEFNWHRKRLCIDYASTVNIYTNMDAYPLPKIESMVNTLASYTYYSAFDLKSAYYQVPISEEDKPFTAVEANGRLYQFKRVPFGVTNGVAVFQRIIDDIIEQEGLKDTFPYLDNITVCGKTKEELDANVQKLMEATQRRKLTLNESKTILSATKINVLGYNIQKGQIQPDPERLRPLQELPPPSSKRALDRALGMFAYYAKWIPKFSDIAAPLYRVTSFPLNSEALSVFKQLKKLLCNAALGCIDESIPFVVECDASDVAVSATLNQNGRPVAFMSRKLSGSEIHYPPVEKEATSVIEAVRKWSHLLSGRHFTIITDQRSVAFMMDNRRRTKIKNDKVQCWRLELAGFHYTIVYRPGIENVAADALTRAHCASTHSSSELVALHEGLCHPGVTRMLHCVRTRNLPYSTDDVKKVCASCRDCAEIKPNFYRSKTQTPLIKATHPTERLSVDFKGPLKSKTGNTFLFTAIDEYSRFPFAIPCSNTSALTVIRCLNSIFSLCGMPAFVHSDRGAAFMSNDVSTCLTNHGVATSRTTPYHPTGNSQIERYNGIIWKAICLALRTNALNISEWETVLPQALHSVRSLLSTATNETPHERFFNFSRRSGQGSSLPTWLSKPGPVFLRRFVRNKSDPLVDEVELLHANPSYAHIRYPDGRESSVSLNDLAPCPSGSALDTATLFDSPESDNATDFEGFEASPPSSKSDLLVSKKAEIIRMDGNNQKQSVPVDQENLPRRSTRERRKPDRYES